MNLLKCEQEVVITFDADSDEYREQKRKQALSINKSSTDKYLSSFHSNYH